MAEDYNDTAPASPDMDDLTLIAKQKFDYDPETGIIRHKSQDRDVFASVNAFTLFHRIRAGTIAGGVNPVDGYRYLRISGRSYAAHRIVWLMMYGEMPVTIDHIDGNRDNNRLANLRNVTRRENARNKAMYSANKSGVTGVSWKSRNKKWVVQITDRHGSKLHVGLFSDKQEAINARKIAEIAHGYHENHGRSA